MARYSSLRASCYVLWLVQVEAKVRWYDTQYVRLDFGVRYGRSYRTLWFQSSYDARGDGTTKGCYQGQDHIALAIFLVLVLGQYLASAAERLCNTMQCIAIAFEHPMCACVRR